MSYSAVENNTITVNLVAQANDIGWSLNPDGSASHVTCNSGNITNTQYAVKAGQTYQVSWVLVSNSGGYVQLQSPGSNGANQTVAGIYTETITPSSNGYPSFYSNSNATISGFTIVNITAQTGTTIAYSALKQKWSDFRTYYPDFGWSQYENTVTAYQGQLYIHLNGSSSTNNFYGTDYQSFITAVFAKNPTTIKTYDVLSYQANQLLVSTVGGITTPLGQQTTLISTDFIKQALSDGISSVTIYQQDNVYSASLWNDQTDDIVNGQPMRGNYIIVALTTVDGSSILKLFSMSMKQARTYIGNR